MSDIDRERNNAETQKSNLDTLKEQRDRVDQVLDSASHLEDSDFDPTFIESLQTQATERIDNYESGKWTNVKVLSDKQMESLENVAQLIESKLNRQHGG
jgi:hypothetical protein